jgi:hypothetical protein
MKSHVRLYGPSLDRGLTALAEMLRELTQRYEYGDMVTHIVSVVDPTIDLVTGQMLGQGREMLGEYDFVIDWVEIPKYEQVRALMRQIDEALLYTGCRYTLTTKES